MIQAVRFGAGPPGSGGGYPQQGGSSGGSDPTLVANVKAIQFEMYKRSQPRAEPGASWGGQAWGIADYAPEPGMNPGNRNQLLDGTIDWNMIRAMVIMFKDTAVKAPIVGDVVKLLEGSQPPATSIWGVNQLKIRWDSPATNAKAAITQTFKGFGSLLVKAFQNAEHPQTRRIPYCPTGWSKLGTTCTAPKGGIVIKDTTTPPPSGDTGGGGGVEVQHDPACLPGFHRNFMSVCVADTPDVPDCEAGFHRDAGGFCVPDGSGEDIEPGAGDNEFLNQVTYPAGAFAISDGSKYHVMIPT